MRAVERAATGPARPGVMTGAAPARSNSTAWRKLTPWVRITQSITEPPTWHAPMQCQRFFAGVTTSEGVSSSWNGQHPTRSAPGLLERHPGADHQLGQVHLLLQPLDLLVRDTGHGLLLRKFSVPDLIKAMTYLHVRQACHD